MTRSRLIALSMALLVTACFPRPLELEDVEDGTSEGDAEASTTTEASQPSDIEVSDEGALDTEASGCRDTADCAHLDGACATGLCAVGGACTLVPRIGACDDGDACTMGDACVGTSCVGTPYVCDDGLACTADLCDGLGGCLTQQRAASCLVAGTCYAPGDRNPTSPCEVCASGTSWSRADSGACDDGDSCTTTDTCREGACVGGPPPSDEGTDWIADPLAAADSMAFNHGRVRLHESGAVVSTRSVVALGERGEAAWRASGAPYILSVVADGTVWLGGWCALEAAVNGQPLAVPAGEGIGCAFAVDERGLASSMVRLPIVPRVRLTDGSMIGLAGANVVRLDATGGEVYRVGFEPVTAYIQDIAVAADESVWVTAYSSSDLTVSSQSSSIIAGPGVVALVRLRSDGTIAWATSAYRADDLDFRGDTSSIAIHPGDGGCTIGGALYARAARFGTGADAIDYTANGFYSLDGNEIGAAGDAFIARFDGSGRLRWARFLKPIMKTSSIVESIVADGDAVLFAGWYGESAVLDDPAGNHLLDDVYGPPDPYLARPGGVIGRYLADGRLDWFREHHGRFAAIGRGAYDPSIKAVIHVCDGPVGFEAVAPGPTDCREVLLSFNGAGGFECSASSQ